MVIAVTQSGAIIDGLPPRVVMGRVMLRLQGAASKTPDVEVPDVMRGIPQFVAHAQFAVAR
jgi:hypothetical protein